ncbi:MULTISPECIES: barstar family protein [unclassified Nocardioides]|uniref:barstar family protein n=1 Tax=unclassified Nocardioides TaxID=2615069 RepID=UPI002666D5C3|nr:barstar family protein [Nocardioides sp. Arc9.136]WKN50061.1 barstar family protein [Nocardioides sp. Arc9.136]
MSGLAALLAGRVRPGVHRWEAASDVPDVRHTVEHAGWRFAHLDGWVHPTRAETLEALGEALALPDWWGRNLDALADCLRDLDTDRTVLLWDGWGPLAREDPRSFAVVRRLLGGSGLAVLLRGEGPDVDVPLLD